MILILAPLQELGNSQLGTIALVRRLIAGEECVSPTYVNNNPTQAPRAQRRQPSFRIYQGQKSGAEYNYGTLM